MTHDRRATTRRIVRDVATRAGHALQRFARNCSGVAAVEFALLLPVMLLLYVGGIEISDGYAIKRKVTNATSALGDLVTRAEEISVSEMDDILDAAEAVIAPYSAGNMKIKVSGVSIDEDSVATVCWSAARHETPGSPDATIAVPDGVGNPESFLAVAEVSYTYTPMIGYVITGSLDISDRFYLKPRVSGTVCYDGECCD